MSTELLRNSKVTLWKAFARSTGDKAHISSPLTLLRDPVQVLPKPSIQSFQYVAPHLSVSWDPVLHATLYKVHLRVLSTDSTVLYEKTENVQITAKTVITATFETSTIPAWPSILKQLHSATVTVTAVGGGFFVTSLPGNPGTVTRSPVPNMLQYQYSQKDNLITLTVSKAEGVSAYVVGLVDPNDNSTLVSKRITAGETPVISAQFSGKDLLAAAVWKVFAQSAGDASHFESTMIYLNNNVHVLAKPRATFDPTSNDLAITWSSDANCSQFHIKIKALKKDGSALKVLDKNVKHTSTASTSLIVNMDQDVQEWDSPFLQVYSIAVDVVAEGSGYFITSPSSATKSLSRISSPTNLKVVSKEKVLEITWTAVSAATGYDIAIIINGKQVYSHVIPLQCTLLTRAYSFQRFLLLMYIMSKLQSWLTLTQAHSLAFQVSCKQTKCVKESVLWWFRWTCIRRQYSFPQPTNHWDQGNMDSSWKSDRFTTGQVPTGRWVHICCRQTWRNWWNPESHTISRWRENH